MIKITNDWITDMCIWAVVTDIYEDEEDEVVADKVVFETIEDDDKVEVNLIFEDDYEDD